MKQSKEIFGSDDWLSREIARESRISAWDLDEGKDLRRHHEENCDARIEAVKHHAFHEATQRTVTTRESDDKKGSNAAKAIFGAVAAMIVLAPLSPVIFFIGFVAASGFVIYTIIKQTKQSKGE